MSIAKILRLDARTLTWLSVVVLVTAALLPALVSQTPAHATQMGNRSIALDDSSVSHADTNYVVSWQAKTNSAVAAVVIDFCSDSPIVGDTCTAPTGFDLDATNLSFSSPTGNIVSATNNGASTVNTLVLGFTSTTPAVNDVFTVTLGDGDTDRTNDDGNGVLNTSTLGSFYARIITYDTVGNAASYASTNLGSGNVDDGGIAMSTANELTITARVQEVLEFCVGNADAATTNDCNDITGTTIDMGVLDAGSVTESSERLIDGESHGYLMMRTNGLNGLSLTYLGDILRSGGNSIQAVGTTESAIVAGTTDFGMHVVDVAVDDDSEGSSAVNTTNGTTTNLVLDGDFNQLDDYTYSGSATVADTIATSPTVLDDEMVILDFAGTVSNLIPTGLYTTTVTFIATGLF